MKELNDIDKLIRSSLADYKPVPETQSKERFLASATRLWIAGNGKGVNWKLILLAALLLTGIAGSTYYYSATGNSGQTMGTAAISHNPYENNMQEAVAPETAINKNNNAEIKESDLKTNNNISSEYETGVQAKNTTDAPGKSTETRFSDAAFFARANETKASTSPEPETREKVIAQNLTPRSIQYVNTLTAHGALMERNFTMLPLPDIKQNDKKSIPPVKTSKALHMAYSLHYRPEFVFNIIDNNKIVHNIGADVQFKLFDDKYIIRTGIGTSLSKGYNEYAVLYNEYLGSYEGLDSVTFAWDENHYHLLPTYYKSEREVFDTAIQTDISRVNKRYTYLQIPLVLGYDFITNKKYSVGVRFGPTFSALLSSKTISDDYDPEKNKIIQINQITPDRINTNWLLMAGLNIGIYSKKKLFYEIEPQFSYYFNSVYQKYDVSKPPFSVGLRLSIGIK